MNPDWGGSADTLNEFQQRHLRVSCQYIDKLLSEIESILNSSVSKSAFPRYISQVSPASRRTIEDYIARIRAQLIRILDGQHIHREKPDIPDIRAISVNLGAIDIAVDELKPKDMRGYGEVPASVALDLNGIVGELQCGGSTLAPEDLRIIEMLQEAAIPVHVLLSKADLLAPSDRERMILYVKEHISAECRLELPVHPVSAMTSHRAMLDEWFQAEILPLYVRAQELKAASLRRKIGALRESVIAALKVSARREHGESAHDEKRLRDVEARLRQATGKIEELRMTVDRELDVLPYAGRQILDYVAAQITSVTAAKPASSDTAVRGMVVNAVHDLTSSFHRELHKLAASCATELRTVSDELGLSNMPAENEFEGLVRAEPVFDLSDESELTPSKIDSIFGARFATKRMAQHLADKIGPALDRSLATYGGLLRSWVTSVLNQLKRAFDSYADSYRAHVERNLATGNLGAGDVEGIVEDLKLLGEGAVAFA